MKTQTNFMEGYVCRSVCTVLVSLQKKFNPLQSGGWGYKTEIQLGKPIHSGP